MTGRKTGEHVSEKGLEGLKAHFTAKTITARL